MTVAVSTQSTVRWIELFAAEIEEHRQELVRLDTAIGDGDHGTNMDRGLKQAVEKLHAEAPADPGAACKSVAMTLISKVGGASGPLYGTVFLQLGNALAGQVEVDLTAYAGAWRKAADGLQARGKAQLGDKTMLDALLPAVAALELAAQSDAGDLQAGLSAATRAAQQGMLDTTPLVARRGRASYLGERSAGHQDPGATSTYYLFHSASRAFAN